MTKVPKMIKPRATEILVSANMITDTSNINSDVINVSDIKPTLDEYQEVIALGPMVRDLNVGDIIAIKPQRFAKYEQRKTSVKAAAEGYEKILIGFDFSEYVITLADNKSYLLIDSNDIKYVVDGELEDYTPIVEPVDILTSKPEIIN